MLDRLAKMLPTPGPSPVEIRAWQDGELTVAIHRPATATRPARTNVYAHDGEPAWALRDLHAFVLDLPQPVTTPVVVARSAQVLIAHCHRPSDDVPRTARAAAIAKITRWLAREDRPLPVPTA